MDTSKLTSKNAIAALFVVLVLVLYVDPSIIKSLNNNVLGRIVLLVTIIFFACNDTTAGLLVVLIVISIMQMYYIKEGMTSMSGDTTGTTTGTTSKKTTDTVNVTTTDSSTDSSQSAQMDALKEKVKAQMEDGTGATTTTTGVGTGSTETTNSAKKQPTSTTTIEPFYSADQLSVDPTRKQKASNSLLNAFQKSEEDNSQPHNENIFKASSQLSYAPF
jgi:hypothetical protein